MTGVQDAVKHEAGSPADLRPLRPGARPGNVDE
jgi:hypothetical protein